MRLLMPLLWRERRWISYVLLPFSYLYYVLHWIRNRLVVPYVAKVPIICVGNVTVGGAGKTPCCIALGKMLIQLGYKIAYVSRGYGGELLGPVQVNTGHHYKQVGDEPLLLQRHAPVFVAKKRKAAIQAAVAAGAELIIMDDGLQNPTIKKQISLLVMDGTVGIGNGYILPAGPLREPLMQAVKRSDAVIIMNQNNATIIPPIKDKLLIHAHIESFAPPVIKNKKIIAFAGIGYPEKFFFTLQSISNNVIQTIAFADHYAYQIKDIEPMIARAVQENAILVTTEKDLVRIPFKYHPQIHALPIEVVFDTTQKQALERLLQEKIK